ncbi:MAG: peptidoglycan DD-metalloendopeptidase family protein [Calditrichaeota bacterium]|nr:peptidoglycan DD-metalloendopeptidase family protein [Calditrichota bacterium]
MIRRYAAFIILLLVLFNSCADETEMDQTPPVLSVAPVDMDSVTLVLVFGQELENGKLNPTFEYQVNSSELSVVSASRGIVDRVNSNYNSENEFTDYEVWIKASHNSAWTIVYDHLLNLTVSVGNTVNPGDTLGTVGFGDRTELQIDKYDKYNRPTQYCPFDFATDAFIEAHQAFQMDWCL